MQIKDPKHRTIRSLSLRYGLRRRTGKKAVETYRAVLARPGTSAYSREIALFPSAACSATTTRLAVEVRFAFNAYLKKFSPWHLYRRIIPAARRLEYKTDPGRALVWYEKYLKELPLTQNTVAGRVQSRPYSAAAEQARPGNGIADKRPESR